MDNKILEKVEVIFGEIIDKTRFPDEYVAPHLKIIFKSRLKALKIIKKKQEISKFGKYGKIVAKAFNEMLKDDSVELWDFLYCFLEEFKYVKRHFKKNRQIKLDRLLKKIKKAIDKKAYIELLDELKVGDVWELIELIIKKQEASEK